MARIRISDSARDDIEHILSVSRERWGERGRARYAALISAALRQIGRGPRGSASRDRTGIEEGLRSLHLKQVRRADAVKAPVHVIFYSVQDPIEILRVLHERMDPTFHL